MSSKESFITDIRPTTIPGLTQQKIEDYAHDNGLYKRGLEYYKRGIVSEVAKIEKTIQATVFGSNDQEYTVKISFEGNGINKFYCTCPSLERYLRSLQLTPSDQINEAKKELIDYLGKLKNNFSDDDLVNIFLHEKQFDQAKEIFNKKTRIL